MSKYELFASNITRQTHILYISKVKNAVNDVKLEKNAEADGLKAEHIKFARPAVKVLYIVPYINISYSQPILQDKLIYSISL